MVCAARTAAAGRGAMIALLGMTVLVIGLSLVLRWL